MHAITYEAGFERSARRACATVSSVSPKTAALRVTDDRPVDAELVQHRRRDLAGERPFGAQWTFWAKTPISVPASAWTAPASETYGGQTTTSTSPSSASRSARQNAAASAGPLYIFQLPAISIGQSTGIAATPGRALPSSSSSAAPPPVEIHEIFSATPAS